MKKYKDRLLKVLVEDLFKLERWDDVGVYSDYALSDFNQEKINDDINEIVELGYTYFEVTHEIEKQLKGEK